MEQKVWTFLEHWIVGVLAIHEELLDKIPLYGKAVIWVVFIMLFMNLIIIPIRGSGMSDRAEARRNLEYKATTKPMNPIGFAPSSDKGTRRIKK